MLLSAECSVALLCPTLCIPMDCSPPGSSVHGISQTRVLERLTISFSRLMLVISPTNASSLVVSVCSSWGGASLRLTAAEQGLGPFLSSGRAPSAVLPAAVCSKRTQGQRRDLIQTAAPAAAWGDHFPALSLCILPKETGLSHEHVHATRESV